MSTINKNVIIITPKYEERRRFETIFKLLGYVPYFADNLNQSLNMLEQFAPLTILIAEREGTETETYIRELKRNFPLLPIIIAPSSTNRHKKEIFLGCGADFVLGVPWVEAEIAGILKSIENKKMTITEKNEIKRDKTAIKIIIAFILLSLLLFMLSIPQKKEEKTYKEIDKIVIPTKNISGFLNINGKIYIYDWLLQSFYIFNKENRIESVRNFPTKEIATIVKDANNGFFFFITDSMEIEKRSKDDSFKLISKVKYENMPLDICFDGINVWILTKKELIKAINNDTLSQEATYSIPLDDIKYIGCSDYDIYYYSNSKIYHANTRSPNSIDNRITLPHKNIIAFDYKENKISYIYQQDKNSYYEEIKIK
ncbi:MAG: response regulator [Elusimicrobiota bacterium]